MSWRARGPVRPNKFLLEVTIIALLNLGFIRHQKGPKTTAKPHLTLHLLPITVATPTMTYKHHQYRTVTPQSEVPLCLQRTPSNVTSGSIMSITLRTPNYGFPAARLTLAAAETREGRPREPGPLAVTNPLTVGTTHTCRGENNRVKSRGHTSRAHKSPTKCRVLFKLLKL